MATLGSEGAITTSFLLLFKVLTISAAASSGETPLGFFVYNTAETQVRWDQVKAQGSSWGSFYFSLYESFSLILLTWPDGFGGGCLRVFRRWAADEGVVDGADGDAILLHLSPQAVKEGLDCVFGGCIWNSKYSILYYSTSHHYH